MADDATTARDYRETVFLPDTPFPMRGGLPKKEPEILEGWAALSDKGLVHLFTQLSADEAVHWATLNNAAGTAIPAQAFLFV